jgi:hypothetical protein
MVDIKELSTETSSEGALAYLIEYEFPKDQDILLSFFEYNGIEEFGDIMLFDKVDLINHIALLTNMIHYYLCLLV